MIVRVTMKDPDCDLDEQVQNVVKRELDTRADLDPEDRADAHEAMAESIHDIITTRWLHSGEYLTVDFDTEEGTATVVPNKP